MITRELRADSTAAAGRSIDTILEVVRHMDYYVAPWTGLDLAWEAALAVRSAIGTKDSATYHQVLRDDPIFGSRLAEAFDSSDESRLVALATDFDSVHGSRLASTVTISLKTLAGAFEVI